MRQFDRERRPVDLRLQFGAALLGAGPAERSLEMVALGVALLVGPAQTVLVLGEGAEVVDEARKKLARSAVKVSACSRIHGRRA